ncbi:MAG: LysM domain-containing protein [Litorimonas sp.]
MRTILIFSAAVLAACSSVDKRPVIAVEDPMPGAVLQAQFTTPEATAACETRKMRRRILDRDIHNDVASITLMRTVGEGTRMLTDVDIDCREYFVARLRSADLTPVAPPPMQTLAAEPKVWTPSQTSHPSDAQVLSRVVAGTPSAAVAHRVAVGETLSGIAREHCLSVDRLAAHNGIGDPSRIAAGQVLSLPDGAC